MYRRYGLRGLGDAQTHQLISGSIASGLSLASGIAFATGIGAPIGLALGAAAAIIGIFKNTFSGCGQTCVAATHIVDQIEPYLKQNRDAYLNGDHSYDSQQYALGIFDKTWELVVEGCGDPNLGDAGRRCVSDRQPGGKWDWFAYYRKPIADDPNVKQPTTITSVSDLLTSEGNILFGSGIGSGWILPVGLILVGIMVSD